MSLLAVKFIMMAGGTSVWCFFEVLVAHPVSLSERSFLSINGVDFVVGEATALVFSLSSLSSIISF
jgi:hypothetical protein